MRGNLGPVFASGWRQNCWCNLSLDDRKAPGEPGRSRRTPTPSQEYAAITTEDRRYTSGQYNLS